MGQAIEAKVGRRRAQRLRLAIPARLITLQGEYPVRLDNLSETGAHVSRPKQETFARCVLKWLDHEAWGEMVWVRGGYCGITFDRPLAKEWVLETRQHTPIVPEGWKLPVPSRVRRI